MHFTQREIRLIRTAERWVRRQRRVKIVLSMAFLLLSAAILLGAIRFETIPPSLYVVFAIAVVGAGSAQSPRYEVLTAILSEKLAQQEPNFPVDELAGKVRKG
ncbi:MULTISPECIES: hypothetical protein [unclassified Microbulbifer]|uniref:hypothetical protein n=1 Tax=unclassified Microbulbifer TaxID=2619833 RepID=UPI0027E5834C|nr:MULTISPECIES: hypothetical protein [unclassified Microbulbifer]